ncbi:MAG: glycerophosphodiester phosphodiesterase [Zoogloeaceae bacterium]|nr:glycerophosphodiester phosphodiesterase [Zoogloeaceae bacterium]
MWDGLKWLGHRGAILSSGRPYQNSLAAFEWAMAVADGFESDACVSRDGRVFLIHEAKYADPCRGVEYCAAEHLCHDSAEQLGSRRIDEVDSAFLMGLRLKDGSPIPTLEDALALFAGRPNKLFNLEIKGAGAVDAVLPSLASALREGRIAPSSLLLSSFNHEALSVVRRQLPGVAVGALFVAPDQAPTRLFPWDPRLMAQYLPLTPRHLAEPRLAALAPEVVVMPDCALSGENCRAVAAALPGARVVAWVFTERQGEATGGLTQRFESGIPRDWLAGLIVDDPKVGVGPLGRQV